ncbi:hypothetical protein EON64_20515, partial [archaeon]
MFTFLLIGCLVASLLQHLASASVLTDSHESCEFWASTGECEKNPEWMLQNCRKACSEVPSQQETTAIPNSFYEIVETDIDGHEVRFEAFRGKVVYLVNVASYCGYTESNYAQFRELQRYGEQGLVIVLAPCNSFGAQEPGDGGAIKAFAARKGYRGLILSKQEVNGAAARPSFAFLKARSRVSYIGWNFEGKFLVDRAGNVHVTSNDSLEADV